MIVIYLHQFFFPWERAHSVLMLRTGVGLAGHGIETHLFAKPNPTMPVDSIAAGLRLYGLEPSPRLHLHLSPTTDRSRTSWWSRWQTLRLLVHHRREPCLVFVNKFRTARELVMLRRLTRLRFRVVLEMQEIPSLLDRPYDEIEAMWTAPQDAPCRQRIREDRDLRQVDGVICITEAGRTLLRRTTRFAGASVTIRNGVDLSSYPAPSPPSPAGATRVVMYVGHFWTWKGAEVLLESLTHLPPDVRLRLVGGGVGGEETMKLEHLARELSIANRVDFTGFVPHGEIARTYRAADCLVIPNHRTVMGGFFTSPMKVFEYMATGVPIVATSLPAIREILRHEENAILVEPDDAAALAAGIQRVLADGPMAAELAARAADEIGEYTWERRTARLVRFFDTLR